MNEMKLFESKEFGQIRGLEVNGEPWLAGKDVAVYMGYKDPKSVSPILEGLPHIGGTKKYSVIDIAERLANMEVYR